jgi:putative colanic acid biosynthesis acetyltransferase WcaF
MTTNLANYDRRGYRPGAGLLKRTAWYITNAMLFNSWLLPLSGVKCSILRWFGAKVGDGVVIKPRTNIKYPWHLVVGNHVWIGEGVWIDNLASVTLESNSCLSQEALLLTGNHDYKDPAFGLIIKEIRIEEGAWVGARCVVCPGVTLARSSVLTAGSVLQKSSMPDGIYQGCPAIRIRERRMTG